MNMKRNNASAVSGILMGIKINRIPDKGAKIALFGSYLAVHKVTNELIADGGELRKKFHEDWKDEVASPTKSDAYLKAEECANETLRLLGENEVELAITPAPRECLQDPELWGEDDTLGDIAVKIDYLVKNGILP